MTASLVHRTKRETEPARLVLTEEGSPSGLVGGWAYMLPFICVRTERNFCAHTNKFPCGRKNIFVRTEIYFHAHENLTASA